MIEKLFNTQNCVVSLCFKMIAFYLLLMTKFVLLFLFIAMVTCFLITFLLTSHLNRAWRNDCIYSIFEKVYKVTTMTCNWIYKAIFLFRIHCFITKKHYLFYDEHTRNFHYDDQSLKKFLSLAFINSKLIWAIIFFVFIHENLFLAFKTYQQIYEAEKDILKVYYFNDVSIKICFRIIFLRILW